MVGYDDTNNALTLGDDDSIAIGDYSLRYSSANDRFEVEHPNGEISDVPRSTSDSLVPQGLAESVSAGEALADDGNTYTSVQTAVNNASGWVFVGPGTFSESVNITTSGLTLEGSGYGTLIDGGTTNDAIRVNATDVTVRDVSVQTTAGTGNAYRGVDVEGSDDATIERVVVRDSDDSGLETGGNDTTIRNCTVLSADQDGIVTPGVRCVVSNNNIDGTSRHGILATTDDSVYANNVITNVGDVGIAFPNNDNIIIGNRIINSADDGITNGSGIDNIIANNRISDSTNQDIDDNGTGTVLDGNLTGPSN